MNRNQLRRWRDQHPWLSAALVGVFFVLMAGPMRVLTVEGATLRNSLPSALVVGLLAFLFLGVLYGVRPKKSSGRHAPRKPS
jgi:hypothetical protein